MTGSKNTSSFFSDDEWKEILHIEEVMIGGKLIPISPLGFEDLVYVIVRLMSLAKIFNKENISLNSLSSEDGIPIETLQKILKIVMSNIPDIVEKCCGIPFEDFRRLPLGPAVEIVKTVLQVNITAFEGLEKNLQGLADNLKVITNGMTTARKPA